MAQRHQRGWLKKEHRRRRNLDAVLPHFAGIGWQASGEQNSDRACQKILEQGFRMARGGDASIFTLTKRTFEHE